MADGSVGPTTKRGRPLQNKRSKDTMVRKKTVLLKLSEAKKVLMSAAHATTAPVGEFETVVQFILLARYYPLFCSC